MVGLIARSQEQDDRYDTCGDLVEDERVVRNKSRIGLCRICGRKGHDKYMSYWLCRELDSVRCMECGVRGHAHTACNELGFSWEKSHLANPLRVSRCESNH
jgi:hypothetical protein